MECVDLLEKKLFATPLLLTSSLRERKIQTLHFTHPRVNRALNIQFWRVLSSYTVKPVIREGRLQHRLTRLCPSASLSDYQCETDNVNCNSRLKYTLFQPLNVADETDFAVAVYISSAGRCDTLTRHIDTSQKSRVKWFRRVKRPAESKPITC